MEWLQRANQPDGKFVPGFLPALGIKSDGDPFQPQVEATAALLHAAGFFQDERALALGKQALLRVLQETTADAAQQVRHPAAPQAFVNRLAACGGLLRAIHELPQPPEDLAAQGRQLARYLHSQLRSDGTFALGAEEPSLEAHLLRTCTGPALVGLARSEMKGRSLDAVRRACPAYLAAWRRDKHPAMVPDHAAAYAEAYARTGDPALALAVFELNDWLLTLQYAPDGQRSGWGGGFQPWQDGKAVALPPDAGTAAYACSLVEACRVARLAGDAARMARFRQALEAALQFLTGLQYTEARVQHFADWYRPWILGGFYRSAQDGNMALGQNQQALTALVGYLRHVAEVP